MKLRLSISAINPSVFVLAALPEAAQTDFFVASVSFQGLNQRLSLVKLHKTDIVIHVQTPSINSGLRTRNNSAWSLPQNQETRLLGLGLVVPLYVPISQPHSIYPLTALASAQDSQPPGDATGSVVADYGVPSIPTMPFVRLLRGRNPNVSRARLSHLRNRESHAP